MPWSALLCLLLLTTAPNAQGKLLDRIVAVFNDQIITLSQTQHIQSNIRSRAEIAQEVYRKKKYSLPEIINLEIDIRTVRAHLHKIGYRVDDAQVNEMLRQVEKQYQVSRQHLKAEISRQGISFEEYFELLRAAREFNLLNNLIISPLVSITEQQIKNRFFQNHVANTTLAISYSLTAFRIPAKGMRQKDLPGFIAALPTYMAKGIIPRRYRAIKRLEIGAIQEGDLTKKIKNLLKRTDEGAFSPAIFNGQTYTSYYVQQKNLVESEFYQKARPKIRHALLQKESQKVLAIWLTRERDKHFIEKL